MSNDTFKIGPIRPPSEANSLLLRVTENCPWNKCKFCMLYRDEQFRVRQVEDLKKDIDVMAEYRDRILTFFDGTKFNNEALNKDFASLPTYDAKICYQMVFTWIVEGASNSIFLQDANTMVLRPAWLIEIVSYIKEKLPELERITSYGRADTLAKISKEDFKALAAAGLNRIHSGYESGSDKVLNLIDKGVSQEQEIVGGKKVKEAGIQLSIYFMPGVGGKELSSDNAIETAKVINEVNPDFIRLRTFVLRSGSDMDDLRLAGKFTECTDMEKVLEIREMLEHIDPKRANGKIASDHIINLLQRVHGRLDTDIPKIIEYIDSFLDLPRIEQKKFQLMRRQGSPLDFTYLKKIEAAETKEIEEVAKSTPDGEEWERLMGSYLDRYI